MADRRLVVIREMPIIVNMEDAGKYYWGVCPECHKTDGYIDIGPNHWFFCKEHRTRWCVGANLFSSWRDETEEEQRHTYDDLDFGSFKEVKPYSPAEENKSLKKALNPAAVTLTQDLPIFVAQDIDSGTFTVVIGLGDCQVFRGFPTRQTAWDAIEAANPAIKRPADTATREEINFDSLRKTATP
jgi:hypothetical protein